MLVKRKEKIIENKQYIGDFIATEIPFGSIIYISKDGLTFYSVKNKRSINELFRMTSNSLLQISAYKNKKTGKEIRKKVHLRILPQNSENMYKIVMCEW